MNCFPKGLRITRANSPLLELPDDHPALRTIISHAECRRDCAGKEIEYSNLGNAVIEQEWFSQLEWKERQFSAIVYEYLCVDLVLEGWVSRPKELADDEVGHLRHCWRLRRLMAECKAAALKIDNQPILPLVEKVGAFLDVYDEALQLRVQVDSVSAADIARQVASVEN